MAYRAFFLAWLKDGAAFTAKDLSRGAALKSAAPAPQHGSFADLVLNIGD